MIRVISVVCRGAMIQKWKAKDYVTAMQIEKASASISTQKQARYDKFNITGKEAAVSARDILTRARKNF